MSDLFPEGTAVGLIHSFNTSCKVSAGEAIVYSLDCLRGSAFLFKTQGVKMIIESVSFRQHVSVLSPGSAAAEGMNRPL